MVFFFFSEILILLILIGKKIDLLGKSKNENFWILLSAAGVRHQKPSGEDVVHYFSRTIPLTHTQSFTA